MIDRVKVVLNASVIDSDQHCANLCGSRLQSESECYHVN